MNKKIRDYVEVLFSDIPRSQKANELKEELLSNMTERFDDYISQGKSENQAYSLVISNLGDVDEMLAEVMPDADFVSQARSYRRGMPGIRPSALPCISSRPSSSYFLRRSGISAVILNCLNPWGYCFSSCLSAAPRRF